MSDDDRPVTDVSDGDDRGEGAGLDQKAGVERLQHLHQTGETNIFLTLTLCQYATMLLCHYVTKPPLHYATMSP